MRVKNSIFLRQICVIIYDNTNFDILAGAYCFVIAMGLYFGPNYLVKTPRPPAWTRHGGICARAIYVYPLTFFRLNYRRFTLNCLRDAQLSIVCLFDWRIARNCFASPFDHRQTTNCNHSRFHPVTLISRDTYRVYWPAYS